MANQSEDRRPTGGDDVGERDDQDLSDLLGELRILLPGAQTLTAFLIILPFQGEFEAISRAEEWSYLAMFVCSIASLVLFTAPAAWHRLVRPLRDREGFKRDATRMIVIGLVPLSLALVLATHLVLTRVAGTGPGLVTSAVVGSLILGAWWVLPLRSRTQDRYNP